MTIKLGSLFDGSGGFPLAGAMCGIDPIWSSEIEPYPIAVTRSRFPNMKHLGSVTDINGAEIEPVDVLTFGSPCQGLSNAGKGLGLADPRSGLFFHAIRVVKEMRAATGGKFPRFVVWENVQGAFSSQKGEDFRVVLGEFIKIAEPNAVMPEVPQKGWAYADSYRGDGWSVAYRVLDAQYWGVPQRRRRVYLVADFGGERAREILFERKGLRGYFAEGGAPRQAAAADAERGIGADDREGNCLTPWDVQSKQIYTADGVAPPLYAGECRWGGGECYVAVPQDSCVGVLASSCKNAEITDGKVSPCLMARAGTGGNQLPLVAVATQQGGAEISEDGICPTITAAAGMSGNNQPWICKAYGISSYDSNAMKSSNPHSGVYEATTARTLDLNGGNPACNQGGIAVVQGVDVYNQALTGDKSKTLNSAATDADHVPCVMHGTPYTLKIRSGCAVDSAGKTAGKGALIQVDKAATLATVHDQYLFQPVVYGVENHPSDSRVNLDESGKVQMLTSRMGTGGGNVPMVMETICIEGNGTRESPVVLDRAFYNQGVNAQCDPQYYTDGTVPTIVAKGPSAVCYRYIVRRLTPTECARLQGFPDKWGHPDVKTEFTDEEAAFWQEVRDTYAEANGKPKKRYTAEQLLKWYNKLHTDSAEYKMWGNGVALPCVLYIMEGIAEVLNER